MDNDSKFNPFEQKSKRKSREHRRLKSLKVPPAMAAFNKPVVKMTLEQRGTIYPFLNLKTLVNNTSKLAKADRNFIKTSPSMSKAKRTLSLEEISDFRKVDLNQLEHCAELATHFKLKVIRFDNMNEIDCLRVLLNEVKVMPKKFSFVPLYL